MYFFAIFFPQNLDTAYIVPLEYLSNIARPENLL